jgi:predicted  nucleic acid-binding Zn-ribbon protein
MNEKQADENPYDLDEIRDLINRVQQSIVEAETQTNIIEQVDQNSTELEKIRDLISRVEQSIIDVETQKNQIEWLRMYFALYFLNKSKSLTPFSKDLTDHLACGIDDNTNEI